MKAFVSIAGLALMAASTMAQNYEQDFGSAAAPHHQAYNHYAPVAQPRQALLDGGDDVGLVLLAIGGAFAGLLIFGQLAYHTQELEKKKTKIGELRTDLTKAEMLMESQIGNVVNSVAALQTMVTANSGAIANLPPPELVAACQFALTVQGLTPIPAPATPADMTLNAIIAAAAGVTACP